MVYGDQSERKKISEGKAKILFEHTNPEFIVQYFKDDITAFNNHKKEIIEGKGILNNRISAFMMSNLENMGVKTHFVKSLNMREQLIKRLEMIKIECIVRNIVAGSAVKRLGLVSGTRLQNRIVEFTLKNDELQDPLVGEDHLVSLDLLSVWEIEEIKMIASRINDFMSGVFAGIGVTLVDFKVEFGREYNEDMGWNLVLGDEISPDSCRLWDAKTNQKFDKDLFRLDEGNVKEGYKEIAQRLGLC